ncbi:potassium channel family protein [Methyloterricola oryzae]|uniref:potassium channel family protein n=1 Tax=Methyloterricola oryzae TaxID=1495050 RepID=UPI0011AFA0AC|nr:potassium channel family protein [Methyloterricola oryzae]
MKGYISKLRQGHRQQYYKHLMVALVLFMVLTPDASGWIPGRIIELVIIVGLLTTGSLAVSDGRARGAFSMVLSVLLVVLGTVRLFPHGMRSIDLAWLFVSMTFFAHVTLVLAQDIFTSREHIDSGRLYGAVSVYLLVGVFFANAHLAVDTMVPGSYQCNSPQCQGDYRPPVFIYFSFITLSSVGYGDILPTTRVAGMLSYLEAIFGQMYLAILVSRLVGMHLSAPKS